MKCGKRIIDMMFVQKGQVEHVLTRHGQFEIKTFPIYALP